jgi:Raf kinase inhibitor-like YbhB/YbcL family protein
MNRRRSARSVSWRLAAASIVALVAVALLGACGADDRDMRPPSAHQTTTTETAAPGAATPTTVAEPTLLRLSSPTFAENTPIPARYTCQGEGLSPQLQWSNVPEGTVMLGLIMRDLDASGFVHWVAAGLDPALGEIVEGQLPADATTARNDDLGVGYAPPCPTEGTHRYELLLYALTQPVELTDDMAPDDAVQRIETTPALGTASLVGTVAAEA